MKTKDGKLEKMNEFLFVKTFDANGNVEESCNSYVAVQTPHGHSEVNRWHTAGPSFISSPSSYNDLNNQVYETVRNKLEKKQLPIYIGDTGYIHMNNQEGNENIENGWRLDEVNRIVFIFNNQLYFQRYENGGPIMCRSLVNDLGFNTLSQEEKVTLISQLE